jgi:TetR/AcrR family transcriptional repressor of nem operon
MATAQEPAKAPTATRILDVAERLVQTRGFNGFSYADIAAELQITKASLHYHYPGKAELGEALIVRYAARFGEALETIDRTIPHAGDKLDAYVDLYADVLRGQRLCLCGILAAEYQTLPEPMRAVVIAFFDDNEAWLARVIEEGTAAGTFAYDGAAADAAKMLLGGLEGAMLIARPYDDLHRFQAAACCLLDSLVGRGG